MVTELCPGNLSTENMPIFCEAHRDIGVKVFRKEGEQGLMTTIKR